MFLLAGAFPGGSSVTLSISAIQPFPATRTHESNRQEARSPSEPLPHAAQVSRTTPAPVSQCKALRPAPDPTRLRFPSTVGLTFTIWSPLSPSPKIPSDRDLPQRASVCPKTILLLPEPCRGPDGDWRAVSFSVGEWAATAQTSRQRPVSKVTLR
jgi:hypothetical protein